jgi:two-component system phosphate regulon sensor histidine kinase PhoR
VILELDEAYLRERLLPQLTESHFGPLRESELVVAVLRRADNSVVYSSAPDFVGGDVKRADIQLPLLGFRGRSGGFSARPDREARVGGGAVYSREPGAAPEAFPEGEALSGPFGFPMPPLPADGRTARVGGPGSFDPGPGGPSWIRRTTEESAPWLLTVRHRGGSIEQAVAAVRRRTLAVGLGVLALLGAAAVVLVAGAQRARRLAQQQLEFVASVTHELNTPLAGIRSAGQNLSAGIITDPAQVQHYGEMIDQEGRRLAAIVAQVLDFAGIESGRRVYAADALALGPLVDEVVADLGLTLEQSGISLERELPPELPAVRGDATALRRVITNLLTNAIKFASSGKRVSLRARTRPDGAAVVLRVEDAGPGIPPGERERVFEPFYRGSAAQRNDAPGSGLGLSLVRRIVRAHGGRVWIEEAAAGGAAVVVELPAAPTDGGGRS